MILRYTLILLLLLISFESINARCIIPPPPKVAFLDAKSVFVGKVIEISSLSVFDPELPPGVVNLVQPIKVRFEVEDVYRGVKDDEIETKTGGAEWGVDFKLNETYVIYAHRQDKKEKSLVVKGCGRTRLITQAEEDLEFLNGLTESKPPETKISSVSQEDLKPLLTETFLIKYLNLCVDCTNGDLGVLLSPIKQSLSRRGSIEIDGRAKSITIFDESENIQTVRKIIEQLDKPKNE